MGTAVEGGSFNVPDRIYVHQLNLTAEDILRRQKEKEMVEEEARKVREKKEIKRRQREEEKKRDMEMLLSYNPWGKPGPGSKPEDPKRKKYPEGRDLDIDEELSVEGFIQKFGRPGHGAPNRTRSGKVKTQITGDPAIRFQDTQDVKLSIENQLRYKKEDKANYKQNLAGTHTEPPHLMQHMDVVSALRLLVQQNNQMIQQKQQLQEREKEMENRKLEEMLEKYPFGREDQPNNDPMFMSTKPKRMAVKDDDFDPWGKGFGNPSWDDKGNVHRHKNIPSVDEGIPDPVSNLDDILMGVSRYAGGAGAPHYTEHGHRRTRLKNTLNNLKSMGPHIDDTYEYDPWGRPGGGAPFKRENGRVFEEKLGWSMTGHPKKRTRDAKNEYRNELQQEIQQHYQKKQQEYYELHEPIVRIRPPQRMNKKAPTADTADIIRKGVGGRPKKDPKTGELLPNPIVSTDVTQERLDIRRAKSQESLAYHSELTEQAAQRQEMKQRQKQMERAQSEKHLTTWETFWGRPGHGAPRDPVNHKKENIESLLEARAGEPYVKHYVTEVVPSKHKNRYDVPSHNVPAIKREYEFRTPFAATEV